MADVLRPTDEQLVAGSGLVPQSDTDPIETAEWLDSLEYVIQSRGPERARYLLSVLEAKAKTDGVDIPIRSNTPYLNTIPVDQQPRYPGRHDWQ